MSKNNGDPKIKTLLMIGVNEEGKLIVNGPLENKKLCLNALIDALKIVTNLEPKIIVAKKHGILDFARRK